VPVFLERFVLPLFVGAVILLGITNPMGFDRVQRITGAIALIFAAYFVAHTVYSSQPKPQPKESIGAPATPEDHKTPALQPAPPPRKSHDDVTWDFDHFLGMAGGGGFETRITGFNVHGTNNRDEPIIHVTGFWRSDLNNTTVPIRLVVGGQRVPPEDSTGIPRKSAFDITSAELPTTTPQRDGIPESQFYSVFGPFTLELEYDGKRLAHHFTTDDILKQLNAFRSLLFHNAEPPSVKRKGGN
jgi:hypothetical protein